MYFWIFENWLSIYGGAFYETSNQRQSGRGEALGVGSAFRWCEGSIVHHYTAARIPIVGYIIVQHFAGPAILFEQMFYSMV